MLRLVFIVGLSSFTNSLLLILNTPCLKCVKFVLPLYSDLLFFPAALPTTTDSNGGIMRRELREVHALCIQHRLLCK